MSADNAVFLTVVLLRFLVPLAIPRFPLPAIVACLVIDAADQTIFQIFTSSELTGYQTYDKALDVYYLAIAYISTMRNWRDPFAFEVGRFLYLYRLFGVAIFELLGWRWLLLVFANAFEYVFIAYEAIRTRWNVARLSPRFVIGLTAFIWLFVKLPQEWWIHVAKLDFTDFVSDYPAAWGLIAAAAAGVGTAIWVRRDRIPTPDWSFTVDVDRHLALPERHVSGAVGARRVFTLVLVEKVVFLALISVIFSQLLPNLRVGNLGIAIGVGIFVVLNAVVTEYLRRRGADWATAGRAFVAMLAVNGALVTVDALIGPASAGRVPNLNTAFFVVLLSLLIAMFDLFRSSRTEPESARPSAG